MSFCDSDGDRFLHALSRTFEDGRRLKRTGGSTQSLLTLPPYLGVLGLRSLRASLSIKGGRLFLLTSGRVSARKNVEKTKKRTRRKVRDHTRRPISEMNGLPSLHISSHPHSTPSNHRWALAIPELLFNPLNQ